MFDYIQNIRSHHTVPCTTEILHTVMRSTIVGQTCAEIADCHEQMLRGEMSRERNRNSNVVSQPSASTLTSRTGGGLTMRLCHRG